VAVIPQKKKAIVDVIINTKGIAYFAGTLKKRRSIPESKIGEKDNNDKKIISMKIPLILFHISF
tara:strand:- start:603 stop:794 length:192 start_codon:yes stop_codon:yes gene_type:complete